MPVKYRERKANGLCVSCGKPITEGARCAECKANRREYMANYRMGHVIRKKKEVPKNLSETITAATEAGMSYGQYVAQNSEGMKWRIGDSGGIK